MKYRFKKLFILSFLGGLSLFFLSFLFAPHLSEMKEKIFPTSKVAHIYIDFASVPSVFQMVDALQQNPKDPKLIILKRFKALDPNDEVLTSMNAQMVDAQFLGEKNYFEFSTLIDENLIDFYKRYPDYDYIVHLNAHHALRSGHFERILPKKQIKAVHLYDDSLGRSFWDVTSGRHYDLISLAFPTYFHTKYYRPDILLVPEEKLIPSDFSESAQKLSSLQKTHLAKLMGIDIEQAQHLFLQKPVAVFLDDPSLSSKTAEKFIQTLIQKYPDSQDYHWLYKNHPRVSEPGPVFNLLQKYFKNVAVIPNKIPLESLMLIGLSPDYIAGYGSSVFYSFKKEQILGYIRRIQKPEVYEPFFLFLGILTPDLIFDDSPTPSTQMSNPSINHNIKR